jgi:hypothetical protein
VNITYTKFFSVAACVALMFSANASYAKDSSSKQKSVTLGQMYAKYADSNYSSDSMPEFNQTVAITGVVLGHSKSLVGSRSILSAGDDAESGEELARLGARGSRENRKMDALEVGSQFTAVCVLDMTSGASYMSFSNCVFK